MTCDLVVVEYPILTFLCLKFDYIGEDRNAKKVTDFITKYNLKCGEQIRYMDLVSEVGELGKEIIKSTNYGKKEFSLNETTIEEMGDCIFSILALCCEIGIDANEALEYALNKYSERFEATSTIGSGQ